MVKNKMDINEENFNNIKEKARKLYESHEKIPCPYFGFDIILNSDGFHHLQFSARRERNKSEQFLKLRLLPLALKIIKKSGTVQEYRETMQPIGKKGKDGFTPMKTVSYWAFIAIVGDERKIKIKTILRRVGDGNVVFWSVMPYSKLKNGQKLYSDDIEDE
jgi:hypothetical protein